MGEILYTQDTFRVAKTYFRVYCFIDPIYWTEKPANAHPGPTG